MPESLAWATSLNFSSVVCVLTYWEASTIPLSTASPLAVRVSAFVPLLRIQRKQKGVFCAEGIRSLTATPSVGQVTSEEHGAHSWKVWGSMDDLPAPGAVHSAIDPTLPDAFC